MTKSMRASIGGGRAGSLLQVAPTCLIIRVESACPLLLSQLSNQLRPAPHFATVARVAEHQPLRVLHGLLYCRGGCGEQKSFAVGADQTDFVNRDARSGLFEHVHNIYWALDLAWGKLLKCCNISVGCSGWLCEGSGISAIAQHARIKTMAPPPGNPGKFQRSKRWSVRASN